MRASMYVCAANVPPNASYVIYTDVTGQVQTLIVQM